MTDKDRIIKDLRSVNLYPYYKKLAPIIREAVKKIEEALMELEQ